MPSWNGGGGFVGTIALGLREISRWISGNVFATGRLIKWVLGRHLAHVVEFVKEQNITEIYFHKIDTMLLLEDILADLKPAKFTLDLHDDFVERAEQYRLAYRSFFERVSPKEIIKDHLKFYLRYCASRFNVDLSRDVETRVLAECDRILIKSHQEYARYRVRPELFDKLVHLPLRIPAQASRKDAPRRFHAGMIGSDDVMNLDALLWFCDAILPRIRRRRKDFEFLIAGSIGAKVGGLVTGRDQVTIWPRLDQLITFYDFIEVAVAPLRYGTGTCVKVLEAVSFGCPIVSTAVGARGILPEDLDGAIVADDPETFAARVVENIRAPKGLGNRVANVSTAAVASQLGHSPPGVAYQLTDQPDRGKGPPYLQV